MKLYRLVFAIAIVFTGTILVKAQSANNPHANPKAVLQYGQARFTVLTPRLIRMEWTAAAPFVDNASFIVVNRNLTVPHFTTSMKNGIVILRTDELELQYKLGSGKFTDQNLVVKSFDKKYPFTWFPGMEQKGNLKGTSRTLDNYNGDEQVYNKKKLTLEDGILATDGWTLIDDSHNLLFDSSDWPWVLQRPAKDYQDMYFLGYGRQYKQALFDYMQIAGKVPLPPRYAFGYWWSRYWSYSDNEIRDVVDRFKDHNLPLDVFVVDMDWHYTDSLKAKHDVFGQQKGWTGWTWNKRLFPDPDQFLSWMKGNDLKVTLNLHPASGIAPFEEPYHRAADYLHFDTTGKANIPFAASNKQYMQALFTTVLHPMEKKGIDFWWLDWQQWPYDKQIKELSNTWWLNYVFFTDMERNSPGRPMLYHRWGGLGNHRYQLGFSGDVAISWKSLAYQPYFTSTASNVLYGYWSHDIGGHQFLPGSDHKIDTELYVRWMQFGALSPIFRTHSSKNAAIIKDVWAFSGDYYDALKSAIRFRYTLTPYIYTMARKTYDTGLSICRPLYYDYAETQEAYENPSEYMFGDDLLVAPIINPMTNGISNVKPWLPAGNDWFEWNTGTLLKGGQYVNRSFELAEYPLYVRAGAIIPTYPTVNNLAHQPQTSILDIFPGGNGSASIYEDAGNSKNYASAYATTKVTSLHLAGRKQLVTIMPRKGSYSAMPVSRAYTIRLNGAEMPEYIQANGVKLKYANNLKPGAWCYHGKTLSVMISLPRTSCLKQQEVMINYNPSDSIDVNNGMVYRFQQLTKVITQLKYKDAAIILPELVGKCEETNLQLQYYPNKFYQSIRYFENNYAAIPYAVVGATNKANAAWFRQYFESQK